MVCQQIVQRNDLASLVFSERFLSHAADHIAFLSEGLLPGSAIGKVREDLESDGVLFVQGKNRDPFHHFLHQPRHA